MKETKEVSHILAIFELGSMDLMRDQVPDMEDRLPSPIMISYPIKYFSNENANPRLCKKFRWNRQMVFLVTCKRSM